MTPSRPDEPSDAAARRSRPAVVVYPVETLPSPDMARLLDARRTLALVDAVVVPPRDAACFEVPRGHFCRIVSVGGPQVGISTFGTPPTCRKGSSAARRGPSTGRMSASATGSGAGSRFSARWPRSPTTRSDGTASTRTAAASTTSSARVATPTPTASCTAATTTTAAIPTSPGPSAPGWAGRRATWNTPPRRPERVHVHGLHPRHAPLFHEGQPGAAG